jgi:hypothetical protein
VATACRTPEPPLELPDHAELRLVEDSAGRPVAVDAVGLTDDLLDRLRRTPWSAEEWSVVFAVDAGEGTLVAGDYSVTAVGVRFIPSRPFAQRTSYVARWKGAADAALAFEPSRDGARATTQVVAIYPSADLLPQNLARIHVQFTEPMSPGRAAQFVRLVTEGEGEAVDPFVPADSAGGPALAEHWSDDATRLTLDLAVDAEGRPLLQIAGRYRLIVDRGWDDERGVPLRDTFEKVFAVAKPDREPPDPTTWSVTPPVSPGAPLLVDFPTPLDQVRLSGALEVVAQNDRLEGSVRVSNEERRWVFSPSKPWRNGRYVVRIVDALDDPSGNPVGGAQAGSTRGVGTVVPFLVDIPEPPKRAARRTG